MTLNSFNGSTILALFSKFFRFRPSQFWDLFYVLALPCHHSFDSSRRAAHEFDAFFKFRRSRRNRRSRSGVFVEVTNHVMLYIVRLAITRWVQIWYVTIFNYSSFKTNFNNWTIIEIIEICFGAKIKAAQMSANKDDCGDTVNTNSTGEKVRRTYVCNKFSIHQWLKNFELIVRLFSP